MMEIKKMTKNENSSEVKWKLQQCKQELQQRNIPKTGNNKFNNYSYYELDDIIPPITDILVKHRLCSTTYQKDSKMYLEIMDYDSKETVIFDTRIKEYPQDTKKNQDYGTFMKRQQGLQTYARRALWLVALDIVEPNIIEANPMRPQQKQPQSPQQKQPQPPQKQQSQQKQFNKQTQTVQTKKSNNKLVKDDAPVTQEKIKQILDQAYEKVRQADLDFTIENADFTIKRLCDNQNLYKACLRTLESKTADNLEGVTNE